MSTKQGMISHVEVELSSISKNFFFTFFNFFIFFTIVGSVSKFYNRFLKEYLRNTPDIGKKLAESLQSLLPFYTNFVILQGVGLLPFKLLEFGSVAMYPIQRMGSRTPRGECRHSVYHML